MLTASARARVLVVDDSVVVRRLLSDAIAADPALEVVGTAPNGRLALAKIRSAPPDVVTLDVEMPEVDGLETLVALRREYPRLPVVMCSALTERGARATLDALARGATDYIAKPTGLMRDGAEAFTRELVSKLKAVTHRTPLALPLALPPPRPAPATNTRVDVVVLGVSTGGPQALAQVLPAIGPDLPVPILIVQHMPPLFTRLLAERLAATSPFPVAEAEEGTPLRPGVALLAAGGRHLGVRRTGPQAVAHLSDEPPENSCRPAVDVLFRSAAEVFGAGVLAVVLTGMGQDGLRGCEKVRARGGRVLAQDEASAVVWGMPRFVAQAGLAEAVLPLEEMGMAIRRRVRGAP